METQALELDEELSFDHAETDAAQNQCKLCAAEISDEYYVVNGERACSGCATARASDSGGKSSRFFKALGYGSAAAVVCSLVWYAITSITGYELGIIAVLVGLGVGGAVRIGSNERGGLTYQILAVSLTYLAIVSTYVPIFATQIQTTTGEMALISEESEDSIESGTTSDEAVLAEASGGVPEETPQVDTAAALAIGEELVPLPTAVMYAIPIAIVFPIIGLFTDFAEMFMSILIIGFALWEAGKLNHGNGLKIEGPYDLA